MPRVAVHQSDGTVFAYKVGNVIDGHHNVDLLTGDVTPVEQIVEGLVKQAQQEYPRDSVVVEDLQNGTWVPVDTSKQTTAPSQPSLIERAKQAEANKPAAPETSETAAKPEAESTEAPKNETLSETPAVPDTPETEADAKIAEEEKEAAAESEAAPQSSTSTPAAPEGN